MEMSRGRDGTAEPVSRDQILRLERGQENIIFPCSADHEQDWQRYPVDPYSCYFIMCDYTNRGLGGYHCKAYSGRPYFIPQIIGHINFLPPFSEVHKKNGFYTTLAQR